MRVHVHAVDRAREVDVGVGNEVTLPTKAPLEEPRLEAPEETGLVVDLGDEVAAKRVEMPFVFRRMGNERLAG